MEIIQSLLSDFDLSTLLPKLDTVLSKVELLARILVLVGPVVILVLGLWYLLLPPKEANHSVGYRFFWGMSSVESWRFTQLVAGIVWSTVGLVLSVIMYFVSGSFRGKDLMEVVWGAVECLFWEMGIIAVSCLLIDISVVLTYNSKGIRRRERKKKNMTEAEEVEEEVKKFVRNVAAKIPHKSVSDETQIVVVPTAEEKPEEVSARTEPAQEQQEQKTDTEEQPVQEPEAAAEPELAEQPAQEQAEEVPSAPEAVEASEEKQEEAVQEQQEAAKEPLPPAPYQQHKNPYGTKKRYPKGTKKKGKK